jgi:hypothetical protein
MVPSKLKPQGSTDFEDLQETVRWSRTYAQNRSLPVLIFLLAYGSIFVAMSGLAAGGGMAFKSGHPALGVLAAVGFFVVYGVLMVFVFSKRSQRWAEEQLQRLYSEEGSARIESTRRKEYRRLGYVVGALFGTCVIGSVVLGNRGYFPISLMQPISAMYCVPFMIFLWWWRRPESSWIMLLWPVLYAVHALLLLSPLPIPKGEEWASVHMLGAMCGYGILAAGLSHLYSRYALRRLKRLSQGESRAEKFQR